jgi:hypothetical protein
VLTGKNSQYANSAHGRQKGDQHHPRRFRRRLCPAQYLLSVSIFDTWQKAASPTKLVNFAALHRGCRHRQPWPGIQFPSRTRPMSAG